MTEWKSLHVYHGGVDRLITRCVHPFLDTLPDSVDRRFWERHYAGGPHLRVRLRGPEPVVNAALAGLRAAAEAFVASEPAPVLETYSAERAAALLAQEGETAASADLRYRVNVVEEHAYTPRSGVHVSDEAAEIAADFRHDTSGLAVRIMTGERPVREEMLRLFFLQALVVCRGDAPRGSVSYKSHWEGFAAGTAPAVGERVRAAYARDRETILALLAGVEAYWESGAADADPVLAAWRDILTRYGARARKLLIGGHHLTPQPASLQESREVRARTLEGLRDESAFVRALWDDPRFMATIRYEPGFLEPRVLTNLLYLLVAAVGLGAVDKMALCHFAFRAVEEFHGCDLTEILKENVELVVGTHADRLT